MKFLLSIITFVIITQSSFAQACTKYKLIYEGTIVAESGIIKSLKLPSTYFLHSSEKIKRNSLFIETYPKNNIIKLEIYSHLTSMFTDEIELQNIFIENRKSIPIQITLNNEVQLTKHILWENINFKYLGREKGFSVFKLNFNEIIIHEINRSIDFDEQELLIQKIIDLPKLQNFYHPEAEKRATLKLLETKLINKNLVLSKFGERIKILSSQELKQQGIEDYIEINKLELLKNEVFFELTYKIEGIKSYGTFRKIFGIWKIVNHEVLEQ